MTLPSSCSSAGQWRARFSLAPLHDGLRDGARDVNELAVALDVVRRLVGERRVDVLELVASLQGKDFVR